MFKKPALAVTFGSVYILLYCICLQYEKRLNIAFLLFSLFPVIIIWVTLTIIKFSQYKGRELNGEEWGYQDKQKEDLGRF